MSQIDTLLGGQSAAVKKAYQQWRLSDLENGTNGDWGAFRAWARDVAGMDVPPLPAQLGISGNAIDQWAGTAAGGSTDDLGADASTVQGIFNTIYQIVQQGYGLLGQTGRVPQLSWEEREITLPNGQKTTIGVFVPKDGATQETLASINQRLANNRAAVDALARHAGETGRVPLVRLNDQGQIDVAVDDAGNIQYEESLASRQERLGAGEKIGFISKDLLREAQHATPSKWMTPGGQAAPDPGFQKVAGAPVNLAPPDAPAPGDGGGDDGPEWFKKTHTENLPDWAGDALNWFMRSDTGDKTGINDWFREGDVDGQGNRGAYVGKATPQAIEQMLRLIDMGLAKPNTPQARALVAKWRGGGGKTAGAFPAGSVAPGTSARAPGGATVSMPSQDGTGRSEGGFSVEPNQGPAPYEPYQAPTGSGGDQSWESLGDLGGGVTGARYPDGSVAYWDINTEAPLSATDAGMRIVETNFPSESPETPTDEPQRQDDGQDQQWQWDTSGWSEPGV